MSDITYEPNESYWRGRYEAPNVESFIFRFYGRILKHDFGIDGKNHENVFDFGCGEGGALNFFFNNGFNVFGVDIAENDLTVAKRNAKQHCNQPSQTANFELVGSKPFPNQKYFENLNLDKEWMDIVISIQTLDHFTDTDCQIVLNNIYQQMKPGAVIYASFNGTKNYYYQHSLELPNGDGLRQVKVNNGRVKFDMLLNFCSSPEEMKEKFSMFHPLYLDYYDSSIREEGSEFRWTFCGTKPKN